MEMRTSGITAPDSPATVPVIDPPATWAFIRGLQNTKKNRIAIEAKAFFRIGLPCLQPNTRILSL
jgi:hypothetical protein